MDTINFDNLKLQIVLLKRSRRIIIKLTRSLRIITIKCYTPHFSFRRFLPYLTYLLTYLKNSDFIAFGQRTIKKK